MPIARRNNIDLSTLKKPMIGPHNGLPNEEAMIQMHLRPVLLIRNNKIEAPDSLETRKRLIPYIGKLESRLP